MLKTIGKRVLESLLVILFVSSINFALVRAMPGDPVSAIAGKSGAADEKFTQQLKKQYGLDKPIGEQFFTYLRELMQLNLGYSYRQAAPVRDLILERLPNTLLLTVTSFIVALLAGIELGGVAARNRGTWVDSIIGVISMVLYATPIFCIGLILILIFSVGWNVLPAFGSETIGLNAGAIGIAIDKLTHLALPATTLALFYVGAYIKITRTAVLQVMKLDFVKTAKAKGVPASRIERFHILKNAVLPVVTIAGMQAGQLVGGAVVVETIFGWPGIGRLAFDALLQRDYMLLMGIFTFSAVLVIVFNIMTDLVSSLLDPNKASE